MTADPGIQGLIERMLMPIINGRVYRKELKLLEAFAQKRGTGTHI